MAKTPEQLQAEYEQKLAYNEAVNQQKLQQQSALDQMKQQYALGQYSQGALAAKQENKYPLVSAFDQYLTQEQATNPWMQGAAAFQKTAVPQGGDFWDNLAFNAIKGLGGGFLGQVGEQDIMGTFQEEMLPQMRQVYPDVTFDALGADGLDPDVARFALIKALEDSDQRKKLEQMGVQFGNPRLRDAVLSQYLKPNIGTETAKPTIGGAIDGVGGPEGSVGAKVLALATALSDGDTPTVGALQQARTILQPQIDEIKDQYKSIEESAKTAEKARQNAATIRASSKAAGYTGFGGGALQLGKGAAGLLFSDAEDAYTAGQKLEAFKTKGIEEIGPAFKGPMSDKDVQIMLQAYPGIDKTEEFNLDYADKLEAVAAMQEKYVDFMREQRTLGVPANKANEAWDAVRRKIPLIDPKTGEPNEAWTSGLAYQYVGKMAPDSSLGATPSSSLVPQVGQEYQGSKVLRVTKKR
jgi:hypothetical protein